MKSIITDGRIAKYREVINDAPEGTTSVTSVAWNYLKMAGGSWFKWVDSEWLPITGGINYPTHTLDNLKLIVDQYDGLNELRIKANRWDALLRSPFRLLGYAGLQQEDASRPDEKYGESGYAHFGCEMWTIHDGYKADDVNKSVLTGFADQRLRYEERMASVEEVPAPAVPTTSEKVREYVLEYLESVSVFEGVTEETMLAELLIDPDDIDDLLGDLQLGFKVELEEVDSICDLIDDEDEEFPTVGTLLIIILEQCDE